MAEQDSIAVIGAGVIGSAIACALAREGRRVLLIDRAPPGEAGASFGNAGHIATELLEPLPSPTLLFGFWRELFAFGGVLDIPSRRLVKLSSLGGAFRAGGFPACGEHATPRAFRAASRTGTGRHAAARSAERI